MFGDLRKRITIMVMGSAALIMVVLLGVVYVTSYLSLRDQNMDMLDRYVGLYTLENPPGNGNTPPVPPDVDDAAIADPSAESDGAGVPGTTLSGDPVEYALASFYSVSYDDAGEVLLVDEGNTGLYSREELVEKAGGMLQNGRGSGNAGPLLYEVQRKDGYTLVAFMDNSLMDGNMRTLLVHMLVGAGAALLLILLLSFPLSRALVRPLEEDDARQKRFVSDAGHELKTPVSVIGVNADVLSRQIGENQWLDNIRYENQRMGQLVTQLLDLSHAQGRGDLQREFDLSQLVKAEAVPFESMAREAGLELGSSIEDGLWMRGNESQVAQLLSILLDNAISHSRGGVRVELSLRARRHDAVLEVANPAKGLDAENLSHAFERFYRGDPARGDSAGHYGLGLSIAKAIAESHDGSISLSCVDDTVRAVIRLPLMR